MYRKKTRKGKDSKIFKKTAVRTRAVNVNPGVVMRGGIRL